jgi:preprotein translocase subunit SecG
MRVTSIIFLLLICLIAIVLVVVTPLCVQAGSDISHVFTGNLNETELFIHTSHIWVTDLLTKVMCFEFLIPSKNWSRLPGTVMNAHCVHSSCASHDCCKFVNNLPVASNSHVMYTSVLIA